MIEVEVTAWIPIRKQSAPENSYKCLENFRIGLGPVLARLSPSIVDTKATLVEWPKEISRDIQILNQDLFNPHFFEALNVVCCFQYEKEEVQAQNREIALTREHFIEFAASELSSVIPDAAILAQLAYPGMIRSRVGRIYVGSSPMYTVASVGISSDPFSSGELTWPAVGTLAFSDVADWEAAVGLFDAGVARTPLQRTLASFTQLTARDFTDEQEHLFWSMQGLESFYCTGSGGLRGQLSEKSALFLGDWPDKKNIVGRLYDIRSKFVHGSFDLERWNSDLVTEDLNEIEEFSFAKNLSIRMLVATLQRCARENVTAVKFDYSVSLER